MNNTCSTFESEITSLLTQAEKYLREGDVVPAFEILGPALTRMTLVEFAQSELPEHARTVARNHEIFSLVQEDPYSHRAFHKPRGYAGDAVMLDYVYLGVPPIDTSEMGKTVFAGTTRGPMGLSVLFRRQLLTAYINQIVATRPGFKILSVASGHCREIENSLLAETAMTRTGQFIALDQDPHSCDLVTRYYYQYPIEVINGSVRSILMGELSSIGPFDLIYSAGLFDYLDVGTAGRLVDRLAFLLRPQGKLLIGNFAPSSFGRAFRDLLLDWQLIYRTEEELVTLFGSSRKSNVRSFLDPHGNVAYAEWTRPANDC